MLSRYFRQPFNIGVIAIFFLAVITASSMYLTKASFASNRYSSHDELGAPKAKLLDDRLDTAYGRMEMSFEANKGQTDKSVDFMARGAGYTLFLRPNEAVFALSRETGSERKTDPAGIRVPSVSVDADAAEQDLEADRVKPLPVLRMQLAGANATAPVIGEDELEGKVNYFIGNDETKWQTDVPTYSRVRYGEVYKGIDVVYYGNQMQLEYDFNVAPGADYRQISLEFAGADSVNVDTETGELLIQVGGQTVRQHSPAIYQNLAGERQYIESRFVMKRGGQVGFEVGEYDRSRPLTIDPVLVYSTFLGGSNVDLSYSVAVDTNGNSYVTGSTASSNFPLTNPEQGSIVGTPDVFVTKINANGNTRAYSTYLGGNATDIGYGIAVDTEGSAYITGYTVSTNFPMMVPLQSTHPEGNYDAFITKINPNGSALTFSTFLGGSSSDYGYAIAVSSTGEVYVTGQTGGNFPIVGGVQTATGGNSDVFVAKVNASGSAVVYSTYLGGNNDESGAGIAVDSASNVYVTGYTYSTNFPLKNPVQSAKGAYSDAFVTKINAGGSLLVYSTFVGANGDDNAAGIAVDAAGKAYVAGTTTSTNFPVVNAIQPTFGGGGDFYHSDACVFEINSAGNAVGYSTYLGGSGDDIGRGITVKPDGNAYVTGGTNSPNFPVASPIPGASGGFDTYVTGINPNGTAVVYSTLVGGTQDDIGYGIASDQAGNVYVSGSTFSPNFPTVNPFQDTYAGLRDAFIYKIGSVTGPTPTPTPISPGSLDPSFGTNGKIVTAVTNVSGGQSSAMQSDGKVVFAAGITGTDNYQKFAVVRLATNGAVDTGFGSSGFATLTFNTFPAREMAYAIAVQPDDKILITGAIETASGAFDFAVARLNINGSLDPDFGNGGKVTIPVTAGNDFPSDITVQNDGKIVIAGKSRPTPNYDASIVRLTSAGQLDGSFNGTGIKVIALGGGGSNDEFAKLAVQPDGRIVAVGDSIGSAGMDQDFLAMRFNSNGSNDSTFGSGGKVLTAVGTQNDHANSVTLQSDGRILVGGAGNSGSGDFAVLVRYNSNGSLDTSFGSSGKVTIESESNRFAIFNSIVVQANGKILGIGTGPDVFGGGDFKIVRYDQNGVPDSEFGTNGVIRTKFGTHDSYAFNGFLLTTNMLLVAGQGQTETGISGFALARYFLSVPAATFTVSGRVTTADGRGVKNALVTITDPQNNTRQVVAGQFGNYSFTSVLSGQTYVLGAASRRFTFASRNVSVTSDLSGVDLVAEH